MPDMISGGAASVAHGDAGVAMQDHDGLSESDGANMLRSPMPQAVGLESPRAEQTFFTDPALDRAMGVVMALATEVYVLRDRLAAVERQLSAAGTLDRARLDAEPDAAERAERAADRDAFVAHLMHNLLGQQVARGNP